MATVAVRNTDGGEVRKMDLAQAVFEAEINANCVRTAVQNQMARARQGTASTKSRGKVAGSTAKPWRQKGTGRARAGTKKSPIWRGGGIVFGPTPRKYGGRINRKVTRSAILSCLSAFVKDETFIVVESFDFDEPKTKKLAEILDKLYTGEGRILILTDETNLNLALSARNLPYVDVINCANLNTYDLTTHDVLIATSAAIKRIEETYA
ncbi:MAG: 50S ribosomal protein L4 [Candidatus Sumerlaeia bacterium]